MKNIALFLLACFLGALIVSPSFGYAEDIQKNILIIHQVQETAALEELLDEVPFFAVVLPELKISKTPISKEMEDLMKTLQSRQEKPKILFSMGRYPKTVRGLITISKNRQKKERFLKTMESLLQKSDGIVFLFEDIFEQFSFQEKLRLAELIQEIRLLAKGKIVTGKGDQEWNLLSPEFSVWAVGNKNVIEKRVVPKKRKQMVVRRDGSKEETGLKEGKEGDTSSAPSERASDVADPRATSSGSQGSSSGVSGTTVSSSSGVVSSGGSAGGSTGSGAPNFFRPTKKFSTFIYHHGSRRPKEWINALLAEGFTDVYVSNYEPEWTGELIHLIKQLAPQIQISVIAEGDCALSLDASCGEKNLTIYKDPQRVLVSTKISETNAWLEKFGSPGERVEGILYDVEAYLGPGSFYQCENSGAFGKCSIENVLQMIKLAFVPLKNQGFRQSMVWGSSRNTSPDSGSSYSADLMKIFKAADFQQTISEVLILAYHDQFSDQDVKQGFEISEKACKELPKCPQLIPVIETNHIPSEPVASFYEEGRAAAEASLEKTKTAYGSLQSFAGQGVNWLLSYREPALVNRSVFPGNIDQEGDVKILSVQSSGNLLNPSTLKISYQISYQQTASQGVLKMLVSNGEKTKYLQEISVNTSSGSANSASIDLSFDAMKDLSAGNYEVNFFLTSDRYFNRTSSKKGNIQTVTLQKDAVSSDSGSSSGGSSGGTSGGGALVLPTPPAISLPMIFGFSNPSDILSPGSAVETLITEQAKKGVFEIPFHLGGNITPDGKDLMMGGKTPDLKSFMDLLASIEKKLNYPANTLRIRAYLRASLTAQDASADSFGPGKTSIMDPVVRQNIKTLIQQIATGNKYNLQSVRIDLITLDFEAILASNYDVQDLFAGDEGYTNQMADFIQEVKALQLGKKIGVFSAGFINKNWFPSEKATPIASPWTVSPQNFISPEDASLLFSKGLDVIVLGAYETFPDQSKVGGYVNAGTHGPLHSNFESFLKFQIQVIKDLSLDPSKNLILALPAFQSGQSPNVVLTATAVSTIQTLINSGFISKFQGEVFDFGSVDAAEQSLILNAEK